MFVLLVEKKYPLSRFTLEQLVNVARLQLLELMLLERPKENTKCVNAARRKILLLEQFSAVRHCKLMLQDIVSTVSSMLVLFYIDSLSPQVVSAAKLPILNPTEFDLWKMRIEQYFLMTDYSLWEVILNGDSPVPTRLVEGVAQLVAPTTVEQKLARKMS
nr:hypothetical protein [Tanacetum cinerariifolium]